MKDLKKLLDQMTIEEKIGQLVQYPSTMFLLSDEDLTGPFKQQGITDEEVSTLGSVIGGKDAESVCAIQDRHLEMDRNKIPLLFMRDVIHGYKTIYPIPLALGCSFDTELVAEGVYATTYENGIIIYVNYNSEDYVTEKGITVPECGYAVEE